MSPREVAFIALGALFVGVVAYTTLSGVMVVVPKHADVHYVCYYADGPSVVEVCLDCPLRREAYVDLLSPKLVASAPRCTVVGRQAFPLDSPVVVAANATIRAVRLPNGTYALETPNGTTRVLCFRG